MGSAADDSLVDGASGVIDAFSVVGRAVVLDDASPSFDLLGGVKTLPSALW